MFFNQLIEDYTFDDVLDIYNGDRYFSYLNELYSLSEEDEKVFNILKNSTVESRVGSLDELIVFKEGLLPRLLIIDQEDETKDVKVDSIDEISSYPVDMGYSKNMRNSLIIITVTLLEFTFYKELEEKENRKS